MTLSKSKVLKKYSVYLNKIKKNFYDLKCYIENYIKMRYEESRLAHEIFELCDMRDIFKDQTTKEFLSSISEVKNKHHKEGINDKEKIESNLFFETENQLVWIDSVIDLLERVKNISTQLKTINKKLQTYNDHSVQYDLAADQSSLTARFEKMVKGLATELKLLMNGNRVFFENTLKSELIDSQIKYIAEVTKIYQSFGDLTASIMVDPLGNSTDTFRNLKDSTDLVGADEPFQDLYNVDQNEAYDDHKLDEFDVPEDLDEYSD